MVFREERRKQLRDYSVVDNEEGLLKLTFDDASVLFLTSNGCSSNHFPIAPDYLPLAIKEFVENERFDPRDYAFVDGGTIGRCITIYVGDSNSDEGYCTTVSHLLSIEPCVYRDGYRDDFAISTRQSTTRPPR